jgi:hypothetical protein
MLPICKGFYLSIMENQKKYLMDYKKRPMSHKKKFNPF